MVNRVGLSSQLGGTSLRVWNAMINWVGPTEVGPGQVLRRRCTAGAKVHQRSRNGVVNCLRPGYRVA